MKTEIKNLVELLFPGGLPWEDEVRELPWPTLEQLKAIGSSGSRFIDEYLIGDPYRSDDTPQSHARRCLERFWTAHPELTRPQP